MNEDLTALMEKHLLGQLTPDEAALLAQAMAEDESAADQFAQLTRLEFALSAAMKEGGRTGLYQRRMNRAAEEAESTPRPRLIPVRKLAVAAGIAALLGLTWSLVQNAGPAVPVTSGKKSQGVRERLLALPQEGGAARPVESAELKRDLRSFFVPESNLRSVPVSKALATLETMWLEAQPNDSSAVRFTIAADVSQRWLKPEDEPLVSREIPRLSLLTSLDLIAAQAGLKTTATDQGVILVNETRRETAQERTWTIPLADAVFTAFLHDAQASTDKAELEIARLNQSEPGLTAPGLVSASRPSWLVLGQPLGGTFPVTPNMDDYIIDLNVAPEVVDFMEFEGFINYGSPIQTTGINALGVEENVILTDSKITQPVFATRTLRMAPDKPENLTRILAVHGFHGAGTEWNAEAGTFTARGQASALRIATAVASAIEESAGAGLCLEVKLLEWKDSPTSESPAPASGEPAAAIEILTPDGVAALLKQPGARLKETAQTTPVADGSLELDLRHSLAMPAGSDPAELRIGPHITASAARRLPGTAFEATISFYCTLIRGQDIVNGVSYPTPVTSSWTGKNIKAGADSWYRFNFPASGETPASTLLIRIKPATVTR